MQLCPVPYSRLESCVQYKYSSRFTVQVQIYYNLVSCLWKIAQELHYDLCPRISAVATD